MKIRRLIAALAGAALLGGCDRGGDDGLGAATGAIRLNQVGFYPAGPKLAFVLGAAADSFRVVAAEGGRTVFRGALGPPRGGAFSRDTTRAADFSALARPGTYRVVVPGVGASHPFRVAASVHDSLARAALKGFWFQRTDQPLEERWAGPWHRPVGHPDTSILIHPSAATAPRPAGSRIRSPGGWYDAGDYNKYIVNSGITTATLLSFYEDFPEYAARLRAGTPDSGDDLPDVLQEALYNLRWMRTMQDPADGGVYHKLTEARFSGFVMPERVTAERYVVMKSTAATLDFAAVMAQAARVLPRAGVANTAQADSLLDAALRAWAWARRNPAVVYDQEAMNRGFDPDVVTGAYDDRTLDDEFAWAAAELLAATRQDSFYTAVAIVPTDSTPLPEWAVVRTLGLYTLVRAGDALPAAARADLPRIRQLIVRLGNGYARAASTTAYATPMGGGRRDWIWGSSAVAANQGIALVQAYRLTRDPAYLRHALANLDYLLGRNATGYSFVTGFGGKPPMHPHHRPSGADGVEAPVPGLLAGGPNPGRQDRADCTYNDTTWDRAYVDHVCSYASNEIAINWNAPLVYLAASIEALQGEAGLAPAGRR